MRWVRCAALAGAIILCQPLHAQEAGEALSDPADELRLTDGPRPAAAENDTFGAAMLETHRLSLTASRRLQLAAESSGTVCLVLRRWKRGAAPQAGTAALTRWVVGPRPSTAPSGLPRPSWRLELARCRGGTPRSWTSCRT